jgi:phenylacetate-coenzyme A ligase PaaK-like adenylate-forming protein
MPERTEPRRDGPARIRSFGGTGDTGDAWARVRREISHMARQTSEQIQRRWFDQAGPLLRYHAWESLNPAYRELLDDAGVDPAPAGQTAATWSRVPTVDKQWLARAGYDRQPACPGPVLVVGTSGSTATQVLVPVTTECANRGLGDNFLRALAMSGVDRGHRHWGIEHRPDGQEQGVTGSSVSMTWLARHCGDNALITVATDRLDEQLRRATAFAPYTISGSPGFLQQIARRKPPCAPRSCCTAGQPWRAPTLSGCGLVSPGRGSPPSTRRPRREPWESRPAMTVCTARSPRRTSSR